MCSKQIHTNDLQRTDTEVETESVPNSIGNHAVYEKNVLHTKLLRFEMHPSNSILNTQLT